MNQNNKRQINNLGSPQNNSSATNKAYVDGEVQKKVDTINVVLRDGSNSMNSDLNMGNNSIINVKEPTNDTDAVNKKYIDDQISTTIQTANDDNVFRYVMEYHSSQLTEEDDVELGDIKTYNSSPHQINKNAVEMKLILDSSKGYYSSRLGINLYPLRINDYTICFELFWTSPNVNTVYMDGISSVETIHKTLLSQKHSRLICQFTKSSNIKNNYLYIDLEIKLNSGESYTPKFQTYFVVYGVESLQSDVHPNIYDALFYSENGYVFFNESIDMLGKKITGMNNAIDNSEAVNLGQMKNADDLLKIELEKKIKITELNSKLAEFEKSYYQEIFETFFDVTDANSFIVDDTFGAEVKYVECQNKNGFIVTEYMQGDFDLSAFDKNLGTVLNGAVISLKATMSTNKYTIFISFKHNTQFTDATKNLVGFGGINPNKKFTYSDPRYSINNQQFIINNQNDNNDRISILSDYQNKNLFMWIMKNGNNVRYGLVNGAYLDKNYSVTNVTTRNIIIELPYKIKRIGISKNVYSFSSKEFNKICFLEKANGVYFI